VAKVSRSRFLLIPIGNFAGHVRGFASVTATSRTLTVEADVDNGSGELKPGQFATIRVLLPQSESAVMVPSALCGPCCANFS